MNKVLHVIAWLCKALGIFGALNAIPFIDPARGLVIFAAASLFKDFLLGLGDVLDDGKRNNSFAPLVALIAIPALLGFGLTGCASGASLARELAKDPATVGFSIQLVTPWGQQLVSLARTGSTNSATAGNGSASVVPK
jgi:hypothetical protein